MLVNRATGAPVQLGTVTLTELAELPAGPGGRGAGGRRRAGAGALPDRPGRPRPLRRRRREPGQADPLAAARNLGAVPGPLRRLGRRPARGPGRPRSPPGARRPGGRGRDRPRPPRPAAPRPGPAEGARPGSSCRSPARCPASPRRARPRRWRGAWSGSTATAWPTARPTTRSTPRSARRCGGGSPRRSPRGQGRRQPRRACLIRLGPGPTLLGGPDTGFDDATFARFVRETFDPETARGVPGLGDRPTPDRFAARVAVPRRVGPDALADLAVARDRRALRRAGRGGAAGVAPGALLAVATPGLGRRPGRHRGAAGRPRRPRPEPGLARRRARPRRLALGRARADRPPRRRPSAPTTWRTTWPPAPSSTPRSPPAPRRGLLLDVEERWPDRPAARRRRGPPAPSPATGLSLSAPAARGRRRRRRAARATPWRRSTRAGSCWRRRPSPGTRSGSAGSPGSSAPCPPTPLGGPPAAGLRRGRPARTAASDQTYLALANDTPYPIRLDTRARRPGDRRRSTTSAAACCSGPSRDAAGRHLVLDLLPFGVAAVRIGARRGQGRVGDALPLRGRARRACRPGTTSSPTQLSRLNRGSGRTDKDRAEPGPRRPNPGFEPDAPSGAVPLQIGPTRRARPRPAAGRSSAAMGGGAVDRPGAAALGPGQPAARRPGAPGVGRQRRLRPRRPLVADDPGLAPRRPARRQGPGLDRGRGGRASRSAAAPS